MCGYILKHTIYSKTFQGENFHGFAVFHSIANVFPQAMALLIGYKHASMKVFPQMAILYPNRESFPTQKFCCIHTRILARCYYLHIMHYLCA